MRSKSVTIWVMVVTAIFVPTATASSILQSAHYDFGIEPGASSFQEYMGGFFTQFDDLGGTRILERVTLSYSIIASAHITVENDTEYFMDTVHVTQTVHLGITPWPSPIDMYDEYGTDLQASDAVAGSGPDFYDFGTLSVDGGGYWDTAYEMAWSASDMAWFSSGNPEDELVFNGSAGFVLGDGWSPVLTISDFTASMNANLTYEYSVVPEPATLILLGLGVLALRSKHKN